MKLYYLLILVILPMILIPVFADSHHIPPISVTTDKSEYMVGELIVISGNVNPVIGKIPVRIQIIHEATYVHLAQIEVAQDGTFSESVIAEGPLWKNGGEYIVRASYQDQIVETTFMYNPDSPPIPNPIILTTDKQSYNEIETIQITGEINELELSPTDQIAIILHDKDNNILINESLISITNNTFSHEIITSDTITDDNVWIDYLGDVKITAQLQNYTADTTIHYSYYPKEISLEYLHDMISENIITIKEQNTLLKTMLKAIIKLQSQMAELIDEPIIIDDPVIREQMTIISSDHKELNSKLKEITKDVKKLQTVIKKMR